MASRALWLGISVLYYGALMGAQVGAPQLFLWTPVTATIPPFYGAYAAVFFGLGACLLGLVGRTFAELGPASWRLLVLVLGAGLALLDLWLGAVMAGLPLSAEVFMSALFGLVVSVVLARVLPARVVTRWQGRHP